MEIHGKREAVRRLFRGGGVAGQHRRASDEI